MRGVMVCVVASLGCGSVKNSPADANTVVDSAAGCQPKVLLVGGTDVAPQGWAIVMQAPASISTSLDGTCCP